LNSLLHKWWQDDDEPLYYVSGPRGVTLAKPCDADQRAHWLLQRGKYAAALQIVEAAGYAKPETREAYAPLHTAGMTDCMHLVSTIQVTDYILDG
jgi:hypothetical protein